ncbi:MAG: hypothetical protein ABSG31_17740 [Tepidisphaeraceae bacterium]|jgi:hypothetical protein
MKRLFALALWMLVCSGIANGQTAPSGDTQTFELDAIAPPTPALKYQLMFDPVDSTSGNAAMAYTQAVLLLDKDAATDIPAALQAGDDTFDALAQSVYTKNQRVFTTLEIAGHCDSCDWQVTFGPHHIDSDVTQLRAIHMLANLIQIRAKQLIHAGNVDDALATLQLGYELCDRTCQRPLFLSAYLSFVMTISMDNQTAELMNLPDSPNLYWALVSLPHPQYEMRTALEGERKSALFHGADGMLTTPQDTAKMLQDASHDKDFAQAMQDAQTYYAGTRNMSVDDVKKLDQAMVFDTYQYELYSQHFDDWYKLFALPLPEMMAGQEAIEKKIAADPERWTIPPRIRQVQGLCRVERETAALTAVEAIRSYAAAKGGKLPAHLEDITDTPAPLNPWTAKPFDYQVDGGTATLSDPQPKDDPLTYTISILPQLP